MKNRFGQSRTKTDGTHVYNSKGEVLYMRDDVYAGGWYGLFHYVTAWPKDSGKEPQQ